MKVAPARALVGHVVVPGDKSVSHRAVLLGAIADGGKQDRAMRDRLVARHHRVPDERAGRLDLHSPTTGETTTP